MILTRLCLLIVLFSFFLSGCSALKDLASVKKPEISVDDIQISDISLRDIELTFDISVDNPNPVAINLASYDFDFQVEGNSFVKGNQPLTTEINPNAGSVIQIPVRFTFVDLYQTFSSLKEKDETEYEFKSTIGVNLPLLGLTEIPIEKSGVFPVVKAPKISATKLNVKNISFTKADLELELNINNPNNFTVILNNLNYNVDINGLQSISGTTSQKMPVSAKESSIVTIPVSFNLIQLGRSAYQLLQSNKPLDYSLSGSTNVDASLPFFNTSEYNFNRSGSLDIFN